MAARPAAVAGAKIVSEGAERGLSALAAAGRDAASAV